MGRARRAAAGRGVEGRRRARRRRPAGGAWARWRGSGGARWAPPSSRSPARSARPRRRTSSPPCSRRRRRVVASRANFNTDIGMPPEILGADPGTEVLVLEAAMRGFGEIATLAAICEPDVGVITNIAAGPPGAGRLAGGRRARQGGAAARRRDRGRAGRGAAARAVPRRASSVVRFGDGGDVWLDGDTVVAHGERLDLELPFRARHQRVNALAAVAAALAVGVRPSGRLEVQVGHLRGERVELAVRRHRDQRLLQRQPFVRPCRPRRACRRDARRAAHRRARGHARARGPGGRAAPRARRRRAETPASTCW